MQVLQALLLQQHWEQLLACLLQDENSLQSSVLRALHRPIACQHFCSKQHEREQLSSIAASVKAPTKRQQLYKKELAVIDCC